MKALKIVSLVLLATIMAGCSTDTGNDEEPKTLLCDISGVWVEYAYLSDGVFIDVSDAPGMVHYEFAIPDNFTQYIIDEQGQKDICSQGKWTFDPDTQSAHVEESRGWNLDIAFTFADTEHATMTIKGRTPQSNIIIKAKRMQQ